MMPSGLHSDYEARMHSPIREPHASPRRSYGDRFVPSSSCSSLSEVAATLSPAPARREADGSFTPIAYRRILDAEMCIDTGATAAQAPASPHAGVPLLSSLEPVARCAGAVYTPPPSPSGILSYRHPASPRPNPLSLTPMGEQSQQLLVSPPPPVRRIPAEPFKVLAAPEMADDFYFSLVDWSHENVVAVALNKSVYLWNASTTESSRLFEAAAPGGPSVTGICFTRPARLVVGLRSGVVQIWDAALSQASAPMCTLSSHARRVGVVTQRCGIIATGSRDRTIALHDPRKQGLIATLRGHEQEVCGLRFSPDGRMIASGGNDNRLLLWDRARLDAPLAVFEQHTAAVRAIAWSPHQRGVLVSGGGTADRHLRLWNAQTLQMTASLDTGSQVCNVLWSRNVDEIVSTHGFSQNQVAIWSAPTMRPVAALMGHMSRVLQLAASPDGRSIVTGAADETLRFWNIFPSSSISSDCCGSDRDRSRPIVNIR